MHGLEMLAQHPAHQSGTPSRDMRGIAHAIDREAKIPANCFTIGPQGMSEGITLELRHPNVDGPALVMGTGKWVLRNKKLGRGALYKANDTGTQGIVRRADLEEITPYGGTRTFAVLSAPESDRSTYCVVHVNGKLPNVRPHVELMAGIEGDAVMRDGPEEGLFRLSETSPIVMFRRDGSVTEISYRDGKEPLVVSCGVHTALLHRVDYIGLVLKRVSGIQDKTRMIKAEDRACFDLVNMLDLLNRTVRNVDDRNEMQAMIVDMLIDLKDEGMLRRFVRDKLTTILDQCSEMVRWRFGAYTALDLSDKGSLSPEQEEARKARLAKRQGNLQARAEANKAHVKGPSPGVDKSYGRKKDGKKK